MTENICKHQIEIDVRQKIFFTNFVLKWHFLPSEYQTQRTVQIHPKCVWHGCLAFNQRKQFWKKPIKYVFYSFSRNFFLLILTWLSTSKILPPLLYKKCRYDAWESIQDFYTEYNKDRYIWDNIFVFVPYHTPKKKWFSQNLF